MFKSLLSDIYSDLIVTMGLIKHQFREKVHLLLCVLVQMRRQKFISKMAAKNVENVIYVTGTPFLGVRYYCSLSFSQSTRSSQSESSIHPDYGIKY